MNAVQRIQAERKRQIEVEGWTAEHDDQHDDGALGAAATLYYMHAIGLYLMMEPSGAPSGWPWHWKWWKPTTPARDLEKAGALCMAQRDCTRRRDPSAYVGDVEAKLSVITRRLDSLIKAEEAKR